MNLHKRFKELMPESKSVLSDNEILAINRRDYYNGEASPINGYLSMFEGLPKIQSYQEYELMNNINTLIKLIKIKKCINLDIYNSNMENIALFLFCNLYNKDSNLKIKIRNFDVIQKITPVNIYAKEILNSYRKSYTDVNLKFNKSDFTVGFVDALDHLKYERVNSNLVNQNNYIAVAKNGININTKDKNNPFSNKNIKHIISIAGGLIAIKT